MELRISTPLSLNNEDFLNLCQRGKEDLEKIAKRFPYSSGAVKREIRIYYESGNACYNIQDLTENNEIIHHDPAWAINENDLYKNRFIQFLSQVQSLFQGKSK